VSIWSDSQISSWAQEAENEICLKLNLIIDRVAFATAQGQSTFELPNWVNQIRRLTFQGFKIDPGSFSEVIASNSSPGTVISSSRPLTYIYDGFGDRIFKVYPSVGVATAAPTGDLFNGTAILSGMIAEVWRAPDFSTTYNRVPDWFRRVIVKAYVLWKAFAAEGPGQDLSGSAYYAEEFAELLKVLHDVNSCVFLSKTNIMGDGVDVTRRNWRAHPQLPPNYPARY
jgi:hypothetical protein